MVNKLLNALVFESDGLLIRLPQWSESGSGHNDGSGTTAYSCSPAYARRQTQCRPAHLHSCSPSPCDRRWKRDLASCPSSDLSSPGVGCRVWGVRLGPFPLSWRTLSTRTSSPTLILPTSLLLISGPSQVTIWVTWQTKPVSSHQNEGRRTPTYAELDAVDIL